MINGGMPKRQQCNTRQPIVSAAKITKPRIAKKHTFRAQSDLRHNILQSMPLPKQLPSYTSCALARCITSDIDRLNSILHNYELFDVLCRIGPVLPHTTPDVLWHKSVILYFEDINLYKGLTTADYLKLVNDPVARQLIRDTCVYQVVSMRSLHKFVFKVAPAVIAGVLSQLALYPIYLNPSVDGDEITLNNIMCTWRDEPVAVDSLRSYGICATLCDAMGGSLPYYLVRCNAAFEFSDENVQLMTLKTITYDYDPKADDVCDEARSELLNAELARLLKSNTTNEPYSVRCTGSK